MSCEQAPAPVAGVGVGWSPGSVRIPALPAWPLFPIVLCWAAAWLVFCWPWLSGAVTIPWDAKAHFLPQVQFLAASLARGESPFWTPNVFGGHPQIADPQSMIFSPPMLLLALFDPDPSNWSIDVTVLLCLFAGGFGVLLLCRDLGWHWAGALVAAIVFAFGASMAWRLQHFGQVLSLVYFPFALFCLQRALLRRSALWGLAAGFAAGLVVLGRDQVALLAVYVLAGFVICHWFEDNRFWSTLRGSTKPLVAGLIAGLLTAGLPVVLTVLLAAQSNRPSIDYLGAGAGSLHPALLITAFVPHLFGAAGEMARFWGPPSYAWKDTGLFLAQNMGEVYIGAIPILLLTVGLLRGVLWDRQVRFYCVAFGLILLYALGWYTPAFRVMYEALPGVSLFRRPADATFLLGGLAALLSGYVVHRLASGGLPCVPAWRRILEAGIVVVALAFALSLAVRFGQFSVAILPLLLAMAWLAVGAGLLAAASRFGRSHAVVAGGLLVAFTAVDLAGNNGPNGASGLPPSHLNMLEHASRSELIALLKRKLRATASSIRRDRISLVGLGFHWPNAVLTHGFHGVLGYNPVRLALYSRATGAGDTIGLPEQRAFAPLFNSYRCRLADLLGLRYIVTSVPIEQIDASLKPRDLVQIAKTDDGIVYENPRAMARVLFAHSAVTADFDRLLQNGRWPEIDSTSTVILREAPPAPQGPRRPGTVEIVSYKNTEIVIKSSSPDGGWVVLSDVWHPWWYADVDGEQAPLLQANVIFRAVPVPAGEHTVRMRFRPLTGAMAEIKARVWGAE